MPPVSSGVPESARPVLPATAADLRYVVHLQKKFGQAVGFIPRMALEQKIRLGRVHLATENGEPAGYLHHGSLARPEVRLFQAAIQYDAQRRHLGLALVGDFVSRAAAAGALGISLRCLSFLEANEFWRVAGFTLLRTEPGAKGVLNVWTKSLSGAACAAPPAAAPKFEFASRVHPCPACGRPTADTWTRGARRWALCRRCIAQTIVAL